MGLQGNFNDEAHDGTNWAAVDFAPRNIDASEFGVNCRLLPA